MLVLLDDLVRRVNQIITRYSMLQPGDRVGVAVSGGADSVVLLHILQALSREWNLGLFVLHVNHKLRGTESDEDEAFVRKLADALGLPVVGIEGRVPQGNLEQSARRVRQAFFSEARAGHNLQKIALGHTRSDQAETVLFRMLRGSGLTGLAGIPLVSRNALIRPLLTSTRSEIREFADAQAITFREDSSNDSPRFTRNRIRLKTLPALAHDYNPNLEEVLAGTALVAGDEERYWSTIVENAYAEASRQTKYGLILALNELKSEHLALRRRVIRRAIVGVRGNLLSIDLQHIESVLQIIESKYGHDRVTLPGLDVIRSFDLLLIAKAGTLNQPRDYWSEVNLGSSCQLPFQAGILCVSTVTDRPPNCATVRSGLDLSAEEAVLDGDCLLAPESQALAVRNWQPGDRLHRPGQRTAEKVKTLFQEYRIPLWERRHWPVMVAGGKVVWVRGFGIAADCDASDKSRRLLRLSYQENR